ncbi:acetyltransferase [Microbacterium phage Dropshot]|nr:acetyltransferase [Microbacterium phage Dropshot]
MSSLRVAPVGTDAARYAVEHWHYSRSLPVPPHVKFGVWEHDKFIGVVIYSRGTAPHIGDPFGLTQEQVCELTRVALNAHDAPVSQIIAETLRQLKERAPGLRLVVSFADPAEGHHGGIYQAGNWIYNGDTAPTPKYVDKAGRRWHSRQVNATGYKTQFGVKRKVPKTGDMTKIMTPGKHRYLMPLDKPMRRKIERMRKTPPTKAENEA